MPLFVYPNPNMPEYCIISDNPVFGVFNTDDEGADEQAVASPWEEIPFLITDLRRAYNTWKQKHEQSDADGVVASVLLQNAVAEAPGDFS